MMYRMTIEETRSKCFECSPMGDEASSAEVKIVWRDMDSEASKKNNAGIEDEDYGTLYVYAESSSFGDGRFYLVSKESRMDKLIADDEDAEVDEMESYDSLHSAMKSKYRAFFKMADHMLDALEAAYDETSGLNVESSNMIIKGLKWGYDGGGFSCGPVEGSVVAELQVQDMSGRDFYVMLSQFTDFQCLRVMEESIFELMLHNVGEHIEEINKKALASYNPEKAKDYHQAEGTKFEDAIWFVCQVMNHLDWDDEQDKADAFINPYLGKRLSEVTIS